MPFIKLDSSITDGIYSAVCLCLRFYLVDSVDARNLRLQKKSINRLLL